MLWIVALACWLPPLATAQHALTGDALTAHLVALEEQITILRGQVETQQHALTALQTSLVAAEKRIHFLEITLLAPASGANARGARGGGSARQGHR